MSLLYPKVPRCGSSLGVPVAKSMATITRENEERKLENNARVEVEGAWVSPSAPNACSSEKGKGKMYKESSCLEWQGENPTIDMGGAERCKVTNYCSVRNGDKSNMVL